MAWARVDDGWWSHPKVLGLDLAPRGLWVSALSWSCQHKTEVVPPVVLRIFCGDDDQVAKELVVAGLWEDAGGGAYRIHDWGDYQSERAKKAEAGRQGGLKSGESRRAKADAEASNEAPGTASGEAPDEAEATASDEAGPSRPVPAPPDPSQPDPKSGGASRTRSDRATRLPDDWRPAPEPDLVTAIGGQQAAAREFDRFCDYWRAKGGQAGRKTDWQATWRNWLRRTADDRPPLTAVNGARATSLGPEPSDVPDPDDNPEAWTRKDLAR